MKTKILICVFQIFTCCSMKGQEFLLPGKIAIELNDGNFEVYHSDKRSAFFKSNSAATYSGITWMHMRDSFIFTELISSSSESGTIKSNLVEIDTTGAVVDRIYDSKENELVGLPYLSKFDSKLLFESSIRSRDLSNPVNIWNPPVSIVIMDFKSKKIIKCLENIGTKLSFQIDEWPWLKDESRFVYTITNRRRVEIKGQSSQKITKEPGVYLYDISTDTQVLIIKEGHTAVASPVNDEIAFLKEDGLWVYDLRENTSRKVYTFESLKVNCPHWTPDGKYIYITTYKDGELDSPKPKYDEKLIRSDTGQEVLFKKIGHGYKSYTWK